MSSPVYELNELHHNPHLQEREMIIEQEHPKAGKFRTIGVPLKFSETPAKPAWLAPELGEDTAAILAEILKQK